MTSVSEVQTPADDASRIDVNMPQSCGFGAGLASRCLEKYLETCLSQICGYVHKRDFVKMAHAYLSELLHCMSSTHDSLFFGWDGLSLAGVI